LPPGQNHAVTAFTRVIPIFIDITTLIIMMIGTIVAVVRLPNQSVFPHGSEPHQRTEVTMLKRNAGALRDSVVSGDARWCD
jgi:hypothetical protein